MENTNALQEILTSLKKRFVGKNDIIDILGIALIARENAFLYGPPGTAKSAIVRALSDTIKGGKNFEYLLTRFTEPNEIFGPFDIRKLREGELITNVEGMLPEASVVFLDEIFNANSAILNSLLMALNEKIFKRGKETKKLPALMFVGASNVLPEDEALEALFDRFLIRVNCGYVNPDLLAEVLLAGWKNEKSEIEVVPEISIEAIAQLQYLCKKVDLSNVIETYLSVIHILRNTGIKISDRRAVKLQNLIAASAVICNRNFAIVSDLWVLKYIWDNEEQVEILETLVNEVIAKNNVSENNEIHHPQAFQNNMPNPEELLADIRILKEKWLNATEDWNEKSILKDKLRFLQNRCEWIQDQDQKAYVIAEINEIWQLVLQEN